MADTCHCGNPDCAAVAITAALEEFIANGGNLTAARLLWCTYPGCRSFEIVDDLTHRLAGHLARCPEHEEAPR